MSIPMLRAPGSMRARILPPISPIISSAWRRSCKASPIDAERRCARCRPDRLPQDFADLHSPLSIIASDLYRRAQVVLSSGALCPALAASIALPPLVRPVVVEGRVLVDGGATNPLP